MKLQVPNVAAMTRLAVPSLAALVAGLSLASSVAAQESVHSGGKGDYLVTVGKRPMRASQVAAKKTDDSSPPSRPSTGYFVIEGKRHVWREGTPPAPESSPNAATPSAPSKGYFVQDGKRPRWVENPR